MPRAIHAGTLAAWRANPTAHLCLVEVATGNAGTPYLRRTDRDYDVTFGGNVYTAQGPAFGQIMLQPHTEQGGVDVRIPDTDGTIAALASSGAYFRNTRVRIYVAEPNIVAANPTQTYGALNTFFVEAPRIEDGVATFRCRARVAAWGVDCPRTRFTRSEYPGMPGETT